MLKSIHPSLLGMLLGLLLHGIALAQHEAGSGVLLWPCRFELATLPEVQKELNLTDEQVQLANKLLAKQHNMLRMMDRRGKLSKKASNLSIMRLNERQDMELLAKLNESQRLRLNGLVIQTNGVPAILDTEIAKLLEINPDQVARLKRVNEASLVAQFDGLSRGDDFEKLKAARARTLLAELTDVQKRRYEELKGPELVINSIPKSWE